MTDIRKATASDWSGIWPIFHAVVFAGDTYAYSPDTTELQAREIWMSPGVSTYVAVDRDAGVVGTYLIKPNQPGLGSHVANAAFMVRPGGEGRGVGRAMGEHALREAKAAGYLAMQFNFVVSTNERAVALWKSLGFAVVGTLPGVYRHARLGLVDALVMHRFL